MSIVITGATGHLGYHLAKEICKMEKDVVLLLRRNNDYSKELKSIGCELYICDLNNIESHKNVFSGCEVFFHVAGYNSYKVDDDNQIKDSIYTLSVNLMNCALSQNVKTIVYTSSTVVLGKTKNKNKLVNELDSTSLSENEYVYYKKRIDEWIDDKIINDKIDIRRTYPSWIFGSDAPNLTPPLKVVNDFLRKKFSFSINGGVSITCAEDVALGHYYTWKKGERNGKYVLGGHNITIKNLYAKLNRILKHEKIIIHIPSILIITIVRILSLPLLKTFTEKKINLSYVKSVVDSFSWFDSSKATDSLGYNVKNIDAIISQSVNFEKLRSYKVDRILKNVNIGVNNNNNKNGVLLITGIPGRLGNRFLELLLKDSQYNLNREKRIIRLIVHKDLPDLGLKNVEIVRGDICDASVWEKSLEGVDTVYHLAAAIGPYRIQDLYKVNYDATCLMVDACIKNNIRRILYMSTDSVLTGLDSTLYRKGEYVDIPYGHYGNSKKLAENYLIDKFNENLIDPTIFRAFWIFGPYNDPSAKEWFTKKRAIIFGDGKNHKNITDFPIFPSLLSP